MRCNAASLMCLQGGAALLPKKKLPVMHACFAGHAAQARGIFAPSPQVPGGCQLDAHQHMATILVCCAAGQAVPCERRTAGADGITMRCVSSSSVLTLLVVSVSLRSWSSGAR